MKTHRNKRQTETFQWKVVGPWLGNPWFHSRLRVGAPLKGRILDSPKLRKTQPGEGEGTTSQITTAGWLAQDIQTNLCKQTETWTSLGCCRDSDSPKAWGIRRMHEWYRLSLPEGAGMLLLVVGTIISWLFERRGLLGSGHNRTMPMVLIKYFVSENWSLQAGTTVTWVVDSMKLCVVPMFLSRLCKCSPTEPCPSTIVDSFAWALT